MKTKRKRKSIQAAMLTSLLLLLISCQTKPAVKPIDIDLDFPVFPDPTDQAMMLEPGTQFRLPENEYIYESNIPTVLMPLDYWLLITEYKIEVDRTEEIYKAIK